jgi:opacity protein-like surface antigen
VLPSTFANNVDYGSFVSTLSAAYNFTPKILILPRLSFGLDNYKVPELNNGVLENRLDFLYGAGIGIQYQVQKWIRLDVRYDFSRRDSNFSEFDYTDNLVSFTVTLSI